MSQIRRSTVYRLSATLWINDRGEKLQMVDGMLIPSHLTLTESEERAIQEFRRLYGERKPEAV